MVEADLARRLDTADRAHDDRGFLVRTAVAGSIVAAGGLAALYGLLPFPVWLAVAALCLLICSLVVLGPLQGRGGGPLPLRVAATASLLVVIACTDATGGFRSVNVPIDILVVLIASAFYPPPLAVVVAGLNCALLALPSLLLPHPLADWRAATVATAACMAGGYYSPLAHLAYASRRRRRRLLEAMAAIGQAMAQLEVDRLLPEVAAQVGRLVGAVAVAVTTGRGPEGGGQALWTAQPGAAAPEAVWEAASRCLRERAPLLWLPDRGAVRLQDGQAPPRGGLLAWPIRVGDRVLGTITVHSGAGAALPTWSAQATREVAEYVALGLEAALSHAESRRQALLDPLTHLYNARYLGIRLEEEVSRAGRHALALSLLFIDSDSLKITNDRYGHQHGDRLLRTLAQTISQHVRAKDVAVRYAGGDEFIVILPGTDWPEATEIAERLRQQARLVPIGPQGEPVGSVSIGVATFPLHATTAEGLIASADRAMYEAKSAGKDCVAVSGLGPILQRDGATL